jgi:flagellar protein FliL
MDEIMAEDLEEDFEEKEDDELPAGESSEKSGSKKKLIMIVAPIVVLLGVGVGLYFSGMLDSLLGKKSADAETADGAAPEEGKKEEPAEKKAEHGEKKEEHGEKKKEGKKEGGHEAGSSSASSIFMDIPDMLVNLQSTGRKQSFLKIHVALELDNPADQHKVDAVMPRIIDSFQVYLRELRTDDLQGAAGMHLLREELLSRVSLAVQPVKVKDILFREILIQ